MGFAVALGATSVVAQSIWIRELSLLWFGSELCWGMTLAAWLLGVAAGAAAAGAASSRIRPVFVATACALALAGTLPAGLWLLRGARGFLAPGVGEFIPLPQMLAITAAVAGTTGLWVGAMFPAGCGLAATGRGDAEPKQSLFGSPRRTIGIFFLSEAIGTLIGGVCFTFWWVERLDAFTLSAALTAALLAMSAACAVRWRRPGRVCAAAAALAGAALAAMCLSGATGAADRASKQRRWADLVAQAHHVAGRESPFARIDLGRLQDQWTLYLNCQPAATFPNRIAVAPYAHLVAAQCPRLRRALLIGQATGELAAELRSFPGVSVDAVELDPNVHKLLAAHVRPPPPAPSRFADGRHYLKASTERYDLILLAMADPTSIATARFYSRDFFAEVHAHLSEEGVLAFSLAGPAARISPQLRDYLGTIYRAAEGVFAETLWTWGDPAYVFAARREGVLTADPDVLIERWNRHRGERARQTAPPGAQSPSGFEFDPLYFLSYREDRLQPARLAEFRRVLSATAAGRVNADARPVAMFLSMQRHEATLLSKMGGPAGARRWSMLAALGRVRTGHALAVVAALAAAVWAGTIAGRFRRRRSGGPASVGRLPILFSLFTTGAAAMGLEIILLAAFQNFYGYVYSHIALVVAMYMAGVAAGSLYYSRRSFPPYRRAWRNLLLLDAALCLGCVALPGVLSLLARMPASPAGLAATEWIILAVLCVVGVAGGMAVPLAAGLYRLGRRRVREQTDAGPSQAATGKVAGAVDAADCFGGALGGLAAGLVLLPLLGWTTTCVLLALLKSAAVVALALSRPGSADRPRQLLPPASANPP